MGIYIKKVLDFVSVNKFCRICEVSKLKGKEFGCYDCCINYIGFLKLMEVVVGVRFF